MPPRSDGRRRPERAPAGDAVAPKPAATVVLLRPADRGPEVLLTRRPPTMAFGADIHVFPGGRVDPGDIEASGLTGAEAARRLGLGLAPDVDLTHELAIAYHAAAARETREEVGIELDAAALIPLTRWVTPPSLTRRFDVRFFAAFVPPGTEVVGGTDEVAEAAWLTPRAALEAAAEGTITLWQPTFVTLQQLLAPRDAADIAAAFSPGTHAGGPAVDRASGPVRWFEAPWAAGIPGRRGRGWLIGRREVVAVDPADPTGETLELLRADLAARDAELVGVAITSLAPERHAGAEMLAHGLGLPVFAPLGLGWTPYPVTELDAKAALPVGDHAMTMGEVLDLG